MIYLIYNYFFNFYLSYHFLFIINITNYYYSKAKLYYNKEYQNWIKIKEIINE